MEVVCQRNRIPVFGTLDELLDDLAEHGIRILYEVNKDGATICITVS